MNRITIFAAALSASLTLTACGTPPPEPATESTTAAATDTIKPGDETPAPAASPDLPEFPRLFRAVGTEPFWAIHVGEEKLRYMTPESQNGEQIEFRREQTERDEVAIAATLDGLPMMLRGRIEECSDGMSDRIYPYTVTLKIGEEARNGCARPADL